MRILFVNKLYAPDVAGGAEITLANLAAGMQARGHEVRVATTTAQTHNVDEDVAGIQVTRVPLRNIFWHHGGARHGALKRMLWHARDRNNAAMGSSLRKVIEEFDPDVIAFHNISGFSSAAWKVAFDLGKPAVQVLHDYYNLCPKSQMFRAGKNCESPCTQCKLFRSGRAELSNGLKAVIGVSHHVLNTHVENGLFSTVPVRKVVNNAWPVVMPASRAYGDTATTFGFIGALAEWKGVRRLLEAFQRVAKQPGVGPVKLLLAGTGEPAYEAELRATYGSDRIEFLGRVSPESFYRRIDVSVVPSLWNDPLPSVVFESLLSGVAVIGARRGGIPEMVQDGVNGLLYDPDLPTALEQCMLRLATEPGLARSFGQQAKSGSTHFADMERVVLEHLAVCEEAAQK